MTDGQSLFAVFLALYLIECIRWLPSSTFILCGKAKRWRISRPWKAVRFGRSHLFFLPVLPPMQAHCMSLPWLFLPAEEGLELCLPDDIHPVLIPWTELKPRHEGTTLWFTADVAQAMPDEESAQVWKQRLQTWKDLPQPERESQFLQFARATLSGEAVTQKAELITQKTRLLRIMATIIFFWCFGVITILYRWFGEAPVVLVAVVCLLPLLWAQSVIFYRKAGQETNPLPYRFWKSLATAILPQNAMRAADWFCRSSAYETHPLATRSQLGDEAWGELCLQFWKKARYHRARSAQLQMSVLEEFFQQQDIVPEEMEVPPTRLADSVAYCPQCHAQFVDPSLTCADCGNVPLKRWPDKKLVR